MPPLPAERFVSLFQSLSPTARTTFVAELYGARGWETARDGDVIVASRDGEEQRIRVVDPGRFGTPDLDEVDVLVTSRDREAVQEAAKAAGVAYLPPDAVREQLLYAIDRETADALFADTFDEPLHAARDTGSPLVERVRETAATVWSTVSAPSGSRQLGAVLVVALLVGVAVAGPALSPSSQADTSLPSETFTADDAGALGGSTSTETAVTTVGETGRPAGLGERRITDLDRLLDGHVETVLRTPRTLEVRASGPRNATVMDGRTRWNYTARIESPRQYRYEGRFVFPSSRYPPTNDSSADLVDVSIYTAGGTKYRRIAEPTGTTYREYLTETTGDSTTFAGVVRSYYERFLRGERSIVDCTGTLESGDCFAYRIVITGAPESIPDAESYRAVAIVQDDGVISSLRVSYTLPDDDGDSERETVRFSVAYEALGETTISTPDWLAEAKNETSN